MQNVKYGLMLLGMILAAILLVLRIMNATGLADEWLDRADSAATKVVSGKDAENDMSPQARLQAYHRREPDNVEEDPKNPIVSCRLREGTQYLRKHDCTLRGGQFTS